MKKTKVLIPALGMLLLSTAASVTGTVAWFTANKTVTASGMMVKAKAEGSLVITETAPTASDTAVTLTYTDATAQELYASTHKAESTTGLQYITNSEVISPVTGLPYTAGDTVSYADAVNTAATSTESAKIFYKDYTVFISASGNELTGQKLKIELTNVQDLTLNGAVSIDFYSAAAAQSEAPVVADGYVGTLNLAQYDVSANNASTTKNSFYLGESGITIPTNTSTTGIAVLMRVYFDGNLKDLDKTNDFILTTKGTGTATGDQVVFDNRCGKVTVHEGADLTKYYTAENVNRNASTGVVESYNCDTTFAKNVDVAEIGEITLGVKFSAEAAA